MKQKCIISIKGHLTGEDPGDNEQIEMITTGNYYLRNGNYYIKYEESEVMGLEGVTTTLKIEGDRRVTLIRNGEMQSRLVVERGSRNLSQYQTSCGPIMVGISDAKIQSSLNETGGELTLYYTLDINSSVTSKNKLSIEVKPNEKPALSGLA